MAARLACGSRKHGAPTCASDSQSRPRAAAERGGRDPRWLALAYCSAHSSSPLSRSSVVPSSRGKRRDGWGHRRGRADGSGIVMFPLRANISPSVHRREGRLTATGRWRHGRRRPQPPTRPFWISLHSECDGRARSGAARSAERAAGHAAAAGARGRHRDRFTDGDICRRASTSRGWRTAPARALVKSTRWSRCGPGAP